MADDPFKKIDPTPEADVDRNGPHTDDDRRFNVSEEKITGHIQNLMRKLDILPNVDASGNSECPFAEDLFAQKEEAVAELEADLKELRGIEQLLNDELGVCQRNLDQVGADRGGLNTGPAQGAYDLTTEKLTEQAKGLRRRRDTVVMLMDLVSVALKRAGLIRFPGRAPRQSLGAPGLGGIGPSLTLPPMSPLVGGLIDAGPQPAAGGTFGGW